MSKERYSFKYLAAPREALVRTDPLQHPVWVVREGVRWIRLQDKFENDEFYENCYNLIFGTANLINTIENRFETGTPVRTLLYLDKSGRLAAYVLQKMYEYVELFGGEEGSRIASHKPAIRYINIGQYESEKHHDESAKLILETLYRKEDLQDGSTLIVDEYMSSGTSARATGEELAKSGYAQYAPAISQFFHCPKWYDKHMVKGVDDALISRDTRKAMTRLLEEDTEMFHTLSTYVKQYGWRQLQDAFFSGNPTSIPDEVFVTLEQHTYGADITEVLVYLASAGGFLAVSPNKTMLEAGKSYRKTLRKLVRTAFTQRLVHIKPFNT